MEHLIDHEQFIGKSGTAVPKDDDLFCQEFQGTCIGVRNGYLQIQDADDDVFEIEADQFTPDIGGQ